MVEGDYGIKLPFSVSGTTLSAGDSIRFTFKDTVNGTTILTKEYTTFNQNAADLELTEAESALFPVDVLAVGHTHKGTITKPSKIVVDIHSNCVKQQSMTVISACSWLSYGGYAMRKMLLPSQAQDADQPQTLLLGGTRCGRYIKTVW